MTSIFRTPNIVVTGCGARREIQSLIELRDKKRALFITDSIKINPDIEVQIVDDLRNSGISVIKYHNSRNCVLDTYVNETRDIIKERELDLVVAFGGSLAMHHGRLVAMLAANRGNMEDYHGSDPIENLSLTSVVIATTASSGVAISACVCYNTEKDGKRYCFSDRKLLPTVAILDPELTDWLSPQEVARDGMISMGYAIEALASSLSTPVTDSCAIRAIHELTEWLPMAYSHSNNIEYRERLMYAQQLVSMASSNVFANLVCKIAGQIESKTHIPMGNVVAALLPFVIELFEEKLPEKMALLEQTFLQVDGTLKNSLQEKTVANAFRSIIARLDMPLNLSFLGLEESFVDEIIQSMDSLALQTNAPLPQKHKELIDLVKKAL